jgi:hypothetical protein
MMKKVRIQSDAQMAAPQERVMANYKKRGFVRTKADQEGLHMFFSPYRVPKGLTKAEVRTCIRLSPQKRRIEEQGARQLEMSVQTVIDKNLRKRPRTRKITRAVKAAREIFGSLKNFRVMVPMGQTFLHQHLKWPDELLPHDRMTRERFKTGIAKLTEQIEKIAA